MPVNPIDLQTLFSQLDQVARQQAAATEGAQLHAELKNALARRMEDEAAQTVKRADDGELGAESVHEDGRHGESDADMPEKKARKAQPRADTRQVIQDPDLGLHVDISG